MHNSLEISKLLDILKELILEKDQYIFLVVANALNYFYENYISFLFISTS